MTELTHVTPRSRAWPLATAAVLSAAALTLIFAHALAAYWQFYHLGSPGTGFFLLLFVLPGGLALSINVTFFMARRLMRRGTGLARSVALGSLLAGTIFAVLLTIEVWRTSAERGGEGPGAGDLAPYLLHHIGVRR